MEWKIIAVGTEHKQKKARLTKGKSFWPARVKLFCIVANAPDRKILIRSSPSAKCFEAFGRLQAPITWAQSATRLALMNTDLCAMSSPGCMSA